MHTTTFAIHFFLYIDKLCGICMYVAARRTSCLFSVSINFIVRINICVFLNILFIFISSSLYVRFVVVVVCCNHNLIGLFHLNNFFLSHICFYIYHKHIYVACPPKLFFSSVLSSWLSIYNRYKMFFDYHQLW